MGQGCSGNVADAIAEAHGQETGPSHTTTQLGNGNSKSSTAWRQQNARRIEELIVHLSRDEFRALLELFRGKCRLERSLLHTSTNSTVQTHGNKAAPAPAINLAWKRIVLTEETLFSLFASVSALNFAQILSCLRVVAQKQPQATPEPATMIEQVEHDKATNDDVHQTTSELPLPTIRLVSKVQLMRAFHCSTYLYHPRDQLLAAVESYTANPLERSNSIAPALTSANSVPVLSTSSRALSTTSMQSSGTAAMASPAPAPTAAVHAVVHAVVQHKELLFRDFCFALSLCRHGSVAEQLTFVFVLFADPVAPQSAVNSGGNTEAPPSAAPSRANSTKFPSSAQIYVVPQGADAAAADRNAAGQTVPTVGNTSNTVSTADEVGGDAINLSGTAATVKTGESFPVRPDSICPQEETIPTTATNEVNIELAGGTSQAAAAASTVKPAPLTTQPSSAMLPPPMKSRMFSFSATPKPVVIEKTQLQQLELNEVGALKMWLVLQLQLLRVTFPALSLALSSLVTCCANHSSDTRSVYDVLQMILSADWLDNHALAAAPVSQILQYAERLVTLQQSLSTDAVNTTSTNGNKTVLSYAEFMQLSRGDKVADADASIGVSSAGVKDCGIFALLRTTGALSADNVRLALQEFASDVLPSQIQVQQLGATYFSASRAHLDLQKCLSLLHTDQLIPPAVRSDFAVFALDARWFAAWCQGAMLEPMFYNPTVPTATAPATAASTLSLSGLRSSSSKSKRRGKSKTKIVPTTECIKHLVVNLRPASKNASDNNSIVPELRNSCLLSKDGVGVLRLRNTDQLVPYAPSTNSAGPRASTSGSNGVESLGDKGLQDVQSHTPAYVLLPYELGRQLYLRFDPQASVVAATVYRRYLRFASSARPIESSDGHDSLGDHDEVDRDQLQALGPTATQLIHNFNATLEAKCDPHPVVVPLYLCTSLGVATVAPVDTLHITVRPPTVAGASPVCVVNSVHNMFPAGADLSERAVTAVSLKDLVQTTMYALDVTQSSNEDILQTYRVWGLYSSEGDSRAAQGTLTVQHSTTTVWRLLTAGSTQYDARLSDILTPSQPAPLAKGSHSNHPKGSKTSTPGAVCMGFMLEKCIVDTVAATASAQSRCWPTDRILAAQGTVRRTGETTSESCPFKIAERVDMLTDTNKWVVGVVTNIAREQSLTSDAVKVQVTVRQLLDGDALGTLQLSPLEKPADMTMVAVVQSETADAQQSVGDDRSSSSLPSQPPAGPQTVSAASAMPASVPVPAAPVPQPAAATFKRPKASTEAPELATEPHLNPENELNGEESDRDGGENDGDGGGGDDDESVESAVGDVRRPVNPALQDAINKNKALEAKRAALAAEAESLEDSQEEGSDDGSYEDESSTASPLPSNKKGAAPAVDAAQAAQLTAEETARIEAEALRAANTHSGVTWDSATTNQANAKSDFSITVPHTSLRILNLGTMTSPLLTSRATLDTNFANKGSTGGAALQYTELLGPLKKHMQNVTIAHRYSRDALSSSDSLTRVGSALTSANDLSRQGSSLSIVKKAPSSSQAQAHRASFFGTRSSVIPISNDDPRYEHNGDATAGLKTVESVDSLHSGADVLVDLSRAGSLISSVDHRPLSQTQEQGLSTLEWRHLVTCVKNVNTCPFRLRVVYLLVLTERLLALEQGHPHRGTVVLQGRVYDADFYVTPLPAATLDTLLLDQSETATQSSQSAEDHQGTARRTINTANVVQVRPKQRNAFEKFLKSCGKSLQHGLIPKQSQAVPAEDVATELGDAANNDTSNSTSGGDGNGDTNPAEPAGFTADSAASIASTFSVKGDHRRTADHNQAVIGTGTIARVPTLAQPPVSAFPHQVYGNRRSSVASSGTRGHEKVNSNGVRLLGVAGLNNLGNTCFMSASLQCLFRTTPLVAYFLVHQYRYDINARSTLGSKGKLTEEFAKFLQTIYTMTPIPVSSLKLKKAIAAAKSSSMHRPININNTQGLQSSAGTVAAAPQRNLLFSNLSPTTLLKAFQAHKPQFSGADQQDSQEFLCELLDTFHEDLKLPPALSRPAAITATATASPEGSVTAGTVAEASVTAGEGASSVVQVSTAGTVATGCGANATPCPAPELSVQAQGEQRWAKYLESNSSIVTNLIQGQMCSKIVCKVCNTTSANFEPFTTLSMPIPRLRSNSVSSPGDLTTVIVTVYRKMPRLSQILRLPDECFEGGVLTQEQLLELYRANRNPVKIALQVPRYATVDNVLNKAVQLYNAFEADAASNADHNSSAFNSAAGTPITRTAGTANGGGHSFVDDQSGADHSYQNLDSTAQSLSGDNDGNGVSNEENGQSAGVTAASAVADIIVAAGAYAADAVALTTNTESLTALTAPEPEQGESATAAPNSSAQSPTSRSPSQAPPLLIANAIVIDINDKRKGRFGKMLDKRDTLQPLVDESTGECQLILQERCKDITFVASLQASRLSMEYAHKVKHTHRQQSTYFTTLLDYFDASEYDVGHCLYNNFPTLEGRILADFDHVYNPQTYPGRSDHSVDSMSTFLRTDETAPAGTSAGASASASKAGSAKAAKAAKVDAAKAATAQLTSRVPDYSFRNTKSWPVSLFDFQVGDRVDAVDYKGTWYPGSVIDLLVLSEREIKSHALTRYCRDFIRKDGGIQGASNSREACTAGLHVKVHFDGFKCTWDEWYDQRDFERGFLAPVYTKTSRKLKMHEIPIIQRRLVYTTQGYDNEEQDSPQPSPPPTTGTHRSRRTGTAGTTGTIGTAGTNTTGAAGVPSTPNTAAAGLQSGMASLNIEILDCPSFVQGESYRSCAHLYHHVYEQMLRYMDEDLLLQTVEKPVGDENSPFTIRLLSFDNLLMAPIDHYCPVVTAVTRNIDSTGGGVSGEVRSEVVISNTSVGVEFSVADRFNGHKNWEGCAMPLDIARPIVNIYHNKLAIAVDWFVHVDLPPPPANTTGQRAADALIVDTSTPITSSIAAGLLHEAMLYRHDASYQHYLAAQRQRLHAAQTAAARLREQQHRDEQLRQEAALVAASSNSGGGAGAGLSAEDALLLAYKNDLRNGLTIEDVLSKFVHSEDIEEYYCNHCRRPTPGKLHSSIHTLPDVLILHLQRLVITSNGGGKIRTLVKFPLAQLNMRPFTTEQKEYVAGLAELAADSVNGGNPGTRGTDNDNADIYELYGVVNHIGGMNGGHYTALSKCEEVVLQDLATERYQRTTDPTAGAAGSAAAALSASVDDSVGDALPVDTYNHKVEPLSMNEFISSTLVSQTGVGGGSSEARAASCAGNGSGKTKWLKFDDEFVNVVPAANLHNSVVTESAFLLFYQRKQLSDQNLARYI